MSYYVSYYSRPRTGLNMSEDQLNKELVRNQGRIVTKKVDTLINKVPWTNVEENKLVRHLTAFINAQSSSIINTPKGRDYSAMYYVFKIPKRKGGFREICAPNAALKEMQSEVAKFLTQTAKFLPHNAAHGFTKKRNCKTSLEVHQKNKSRWFLKLDIKDFFPTITPEYIEQAFKTVYPFPFIPPTTRSLIIELCTMQGQTPQGAPTSPAITNIVMVAEDVRIEEYCKKNHLVYTRYADDILISSRVSFDWEQVQKDIQEILGTRFTLKTEKTRYGSFNGRNWNLGLMYNNQNQITVGHARKKLIKNMVHNYETKPECRTQEEYYRLMGIVGYCAYVEPEYFTKYLERVKAVTL